MVDILPAGTGEAANTPDNTVGKRTFTKREEDPNKQISIVFQNSMGHATAIAIHNACAHIHGYAVVSVDDVLKLAAQIASVSVSPSEFLAKVMSNSESPCNTTSKPKSISSPTAQTVVVDEDIDFGA